MVGAASRLLSSPDRQAEGYLRGFWADMAKSEPGDKVLGSPNRTAQAPFSVAWLVMVRVRE